MTSRLHYSAYVAIVAVCMASCGHKHSDSAQVPTSPDVPVTDSPKGPVKADPKLVERGELSCYDYGGYLTGCTMPDKTLSASVSQVSKFTLEYSFNCVGSDLAIVVQFGDVIVRLKQEPSQKIELTGTGPFIVKDQNPDWSKSGDLQPGCTLDLGTFAVTAI